MAYVSWIVATAILGPAGNSAAGKSLLTTPLLAAFIMTAWDLAQDPVWSTILHGWIWLDGGPWFGVPISNYLGWLGTVFIIFLLFALYLRRRPSVPTPPATAYPALLFYALCAIGNVAQAIPVPASALVQDPTGKLWRVGDIALASALVSIFVMGGFAVLAWARLAKRPEAID
jgi:putative membrane protein